MENASLDRTKPCPTCGRRFNKPRQRAWKSGIGAVRNRDRAGHTIADVRMALYQCKYAQWKQQEGACGCCNEPMDPKHAVWIAAKWLDGTGLAKWALGRDLVFNDCTDEFDAVPRSPDEILEEYGNGLGGHYLWHKRCRVKFRRVGPGIPTRGPAHVREHEKLIAQGVPTHEAVMRADDILRDQARARMEEARSHKKSKRRTWSHEDKAEPEQRRLLVVSKPDAPAPCQPDLGGENLRAAQEEAELRPMTDLERAAYEGTAEERLDGLASAWST